MNYDIFQIAVRENRIIWQDSPPNSGRFTQLLEVYMHCTHHLAEIKACLL